MKLIASFLLISLLTGCKLFQPREEPAAIDEVDQFATEISAKIEALYIEDHDDEFLKLKGEDKENKEGKEYVKYSAEKAFANRLVSVQVTELNVGSKKYYKVMIMTKTADGTKRSIEKIEMRQHNVKVLMEKINIALRKVL
jgi:hypothetical protein